VATVSRGVMKIRENTVAVTSSTAEKRLVFLLSSEITASDFICQSQMVIISG